MSAASQSKDRKIKVSHADLAAAGGGLTEHAAGGGGLTQLAATGGGIAEHATLLKVREAHKLSGADSN